MALRILVTYYGFTCILYRNYGHFPHEKAIKSKTLIFVFLISHLFMRPAANRRKKMHKTRGKNISELTVDIFLPIQYADKRRKNQEIIEKKGKGADIE